MIVDFKPLPTLPSEWRHFMTTVDQDTIYQYLDGWDLLSATLMERRQMLRELEHLAKAPHGTGSTERVAESAQALLVEFSIIGKSIDTLIAEINRYADRCGKPRVEVRATNQP